MSGNVKSMLDISKWVDNRPVVMLAGRANVGKSTLFNRLAGASRAITSPVAGTTRDLNLAVVSHNQREFVVVDSGGLELGAGESAAIRAAEAALEALAAADAVILVIDGRAGVCAGDREALALVRQSGRPVILAVNKVDTPRLEAIAVEAWSLGVESVSLISAAHGRGIEELLDQLCALLPSTNPRPEPEAALRLALIGRPNVGKSSLLNRLSGFARSIVDEHPGTTRDPVEVAVELDGHRIILIDTAGVRRRTKVEPGLESFSVARALATIRRAEVLLLVIDSAEALTDQDARLARLVESNDRALVIVCNKWDIAAKTGRRAPVFVRETLEQYPFLDFAPFVIASARTGDGVDQIIPAASRAGRAWRSQFRTSLLNQVMSEALTALDPPLVGDKRLKPMYVTQVGKAPPKLAVFCNLERGIPAHYVRFLEGRFRAALGLERSGTPLRIEFRRTKTGRDAHGRRTEASGRDAAQADWAAERDAEA
jgi:GTP-binding protein